jgi:hypothetical protein
MVYKTYLHKLILRSELWILVSRDLEWAKSESFQ